MVYEGINALTGIIPADPSYYRDYEILNKVFVVDHKKVPAGIPLKDKKKKFSRPVQVPAIGSIYRKEEWPFSTIRYNDIGNENTIHHPGDYSITHTISIRDNSVFIDEYLVVSTPEHMKKTRAEKFLKAVIWQLMNDDESFIEKYSEVITLPYNQWTYPVNQESVPACIPGTCG